MCSCRITSNMLHELKQYVLLKRKAGMKVYFVGSGEEVVKQQKTKGLKGYVWFPLRSAYILV